MCASFECGASSFCNIGLDVKNTANDKNWESFAVACERQDPFSHGFNAMHEKKVATSAFMVCECECGTQKLVISTCVKRLLMSARENEWGEN